MVWLILGLAMNPSNIFTNANVNASLSSSLITITQYYTLNLKHFQLLIYSNFHGFSLNSPWAWQSHAIMKYFSSYIAKTIGILKWVNVFGHSYCKHITQLMHGIHCVTTIIKQMSIKHCSNNYSGDRVNEAERN